MATQLVASKVLLGRGGYGSVFLGTFHGQQVAVKRVLYTAGNDNEEKALQKLKHPNIVRLFHFYNDDDFKYFALELCAASLDQLFLKPDDPKKYKGPKLPHHSEVFFQLAKGLEFIHSNKLIHRDIKPENVLISVDSTDHTTIKWADFGLSRSVNERGTFTMNSGIKGTNNWYAPELLRLFQQPQMMGQPRGTVKSDVFALGLVFGYFLLSGQHLYGFDEHEIYFNIIGKKIINMHRIDRSHYARQIIQTMLADNPGDRISSSDVVIEFKSVRNEIAKKEIELWQMCSNKETFDLNKTKELILLGIDVNETDKEGWNVLHWLCLNHTSERLMDAIKLLIQLGINVNRKSYDGWNALHILCLNNSSTKIVEAITSLIQLGINLNENDNDGWNALHNLCLNNYNDHLVDAFEQLIKLKIDVNATTNTGKNALHYLCEYQFNKNLIAVMELLIEHGIDKNGKTKSGKNALHCLCRFNSSNRLIDAIQLLVQVGIDVNEVDNDENNALHYLCANISNKESTNAIKLLIKHGIAVNGKNVNGQNALHYLCQFNSSESLIDGIKLLIQHGIDVSWKDTSGLTALHYLCICNSSEYFIDAIKLLTKHGIDVNSKDNSGYNALHCLCEHSFSENLIDAMKLLIELGIHKNGTTNTGKNALHCLCRFSSSESLIDAIKLLIQHGIDVETNGIDARCLLQNNYRKDNVKDIIQLLDRAHTAQLFRVLPFLTVNLKFTKFTMAKTITNV